MSTAQRLASISACLLSITACGRGALDTFGLNSARHDGGDGGFTLSDGSFPHFDGDVIFDVGFMEGPDVRFNRPDSGLRSDVGFPFDGSIDRRDTGPNRVDSGAGRDSGFVDGGPQFECNAEPDCFVNFGVPRCPNGPGRWQCVDGLCNPDCPTSGCRNDCDCPFDLSCTMMGCQPLNRPNFCCESPTCQPGQTCIDPSGMISQCALPDAGITPFDGGHQVADASFGPDGSLSSDASIMTGDGGTTPDAGNQTCGSDCDCDTNLSCVAGQCRATGFQNRCCTNPNCVAGTRCEQPNGMPGVCGPSTPVGIACDQAGGQCGANGFCIDDMSGFPGGYCSESCGPMSPCPSGAVCRNGGQGGFCLDSCNAPSDCRQPDYNCIQLGIGGGNGRVCWPTPPASMNPMGDPVGSSCMSDNDCVSGLQCLQQQGFPNGYCTHVYCDPMTSPCPAASDCYAFPGLFSLCLEQCTSGGSQSNCRNRYYCLGPVGGNGVCVGR